MFSRFSSKSELVSPLDALDRVAIGYLTLPLGIFLAGWFEWWAALPLAACMAYALKPLLAGRSTDGTGLPISPLHLTVAIAVGCGWTLCAGAGHIVFANADWHIRDAVLHDLVVSPWPVGYGTLDGKASLLRAPVGYYLPAALVGKWFGLSTAHGVMALWTAFGATLFLLQVLSLTPSRARIAFMVAAVVVLFSGFDIIGNLLNDGPRFRAYWSIATHLEWWAGTYQYSSMTTQLFWVPNHALGGWLIIGMLFRDRRATPLDSMLPIAVVAAALWSPLSALGVVPFVLWKVFRRITQDRSWSLIHPRVWAPALAVGLVVAAYLSLDPSRIPRGISVGQGGAFDVTVDVLRQVQFFLLEAGFIGAAILAIRRSSQVVLALAILAVLPLAYFGPGNDLVMRASIPSLAVLAIASCQALSQECPNQRALRLKVVLGCLLAIGAVTPIQEFARAAVLRAWPINLQATLIGANCGRYAPHYVARLGDEAIKYVLRQPHVLPIGPLGPESCDNPAIRLMIRGGLL